MNDLTIIHFQRYSNHLDNEVLNHILENWNCIEYLEDFRYQRAKRKLKCSNCQNNVQQIKNLTLYYIYFIVMYIINNVYCKCVFHVHHTNILFVCAKSSYLLYHMHSLAMHTVEFIQLNGSVVRFTQQ